MKHIVQLTLAFNIFFIHTFYAQAVLWEAGLGIGNVLEEEHNQGRSEAHISILYSVNNSHLGIDFSVGGNFIPTEGTIEEMGIETIRAKNSRIRTITPFYRYSFYKGFFIEPRLGYSSIHTRVQTDEFHTISQSNFTSGIAIGLMIPEASISLRYQHFGQSKDYEGFDTGGNKTVISEAGSLSMIMIRLSYRFKLK